MPIVARVVIVTGSRSIERRAAMGSARKPSLRRVAPALPKSAE
ncbi:MAG TPA: hypothetical protein VFI58_11240 [Xanthobacteraceae bacterium]|nr:hypothetical protein [Xanthobacteraceae bacterium]